MLVKCGRRRTSWFAEQTVREVKTTYRLTLRFSPWSWVSGVTLWAAETPTNIFCIDSLLVYNTKHIISADISTVRTVVRHCQTKHSLWSTNPTLVHCRRLITCCLDTALIATASVQSLIRSDVTLFIFFPRFNVVVAFKTYFSFRSLRKIILCASVEWECINMKIISKRY